MSKSREKRLPLRTAESRHLRNLEERLSAPWSARARPVAWRLVGRTRADLAKHLPAPRDCPAPPPKEDIS